MSEVKDAAAKGMPILGICNGFQMLVEAHLLPGGLIRNAHQQFIRRDQRLRVENTSTAWTSDFTEGQEIVIPLKNADGGYIADAETSSTALEGEGLVAFRYVGREPERLAATTSPASPTSAATSSASCRTPSTPSSRASVPTRAKRCARASTACRSSRRRSPPWWPRPEAGIPRLTSSDRRADFGSIGRAAPNFVQSSEVVT